MKHLFWLIVLPLYCVGASHVSSRHLSLTAEVETRDLSIGSHAVVQKSKAVTHLIAQAEALIDMAAWP